MGLLLLLVVAFVMGFISAVPPGAIQIEVAKRALQDRVFAALMVVAGSVVSDIMYGAIALFGIAPILVRRTVVAWFWLGGFVVLTVLAALTYRQARAGTVPVLQPAGDRNGSHSFSWITGFTLALTNPMMIVWWLLGAQLLISFGVIAEMTPVNSVVFLACGGLGSAGYLFTLTRFLVRAKRFMSPNMMMRTTYGMALGLGALAVVFLVRALNFLVGCGSLQ